MRAPREKCPRSYVSKSYDVWGLLLIISTRANKIGTKVGEMKGNEDIVRFWRCAGVNCTPVPLLHIWKFHIKNLKIGLLWWLSGKEFACQCRRHLFNPWSGKIPHATEQLKPGSRNYWALTLQLLKPARSRACALQQERPPRWEAHAPQPESSPCLPQLEKNPRSNEDPAEPKINK